MGKQAELSKIVKNATFNKIISIESAGKPKAKASTSSAGGLFQFLYATFYGEVCMYAPALLKGRTKQQVWALRFDPEIAIEMGVKFTEDNARALGKGWTEGDLYLAHFLGVGTAKRVLRSPGSTVVSQCVTREAIAANQKILTGKTCSQVRAWAQNAMDTRWMRLGNPDWIAHWYHKDDNVPLPDAETVAKNCQQVTHKVEGPDGHLVDIDGNGLPDYLERVPFEIPHGEFEPAPTNQTPADEEVGPQPHTTKLRRPSAVVLAGKQTAVQGDPNIWLAQNVLKSMHYKSGTIDGRWGGMTAEAVAGFINDRDNLDWPAPTSLAQWKKIEEPFLDALAEAQDDQFVRPVSSDRANADDEKVTEVATEAAPAKRGFLITIWGAVTSFGAAVYKFIGGWFGDAWEWWTDNEDKVPDSFKEPSTIWSYITSVPVGLWFVAIGCILAFVALGNWHVLAKIREDVKTGMRK